MTRAEWDVGRTKPSAIASGISGSEGHTSGRLAGGPKAGSEDRPADRGMSASDSILWRMERDPVLRSTVSALSVLDRPPDWNRLRDKLALASRRFPWLRQVVVGPPLGIGSPRWRATPDFDLDYHLRRVRLAGTGTLAEVLELAAREAMAAIDPTRPPWELTVVEGLGHGAAVIEKFHHAAIDGIGAMRLVAELLDPERDVDRALETLAGPGAGPAPRTGQLVRLPLGALDAALRAARSPARSLHDALEALRWVGRLMAPVAEPLSPVLRARSTRLRFAAFDIDLDRLRAAGRNSGGTLNDAFVAAVVIGLRRYHEEHGQPVDRLRMTLPVSVRRPDDPPAGNRFVPVRLAVPTDPRPTRAVIEAVSTTVRDWREGPALGLTDAMADALNLLPTPVLARVFGAILRNVDFVATNVPGPTTPVYLAGAEILGQYAFAPPSGAAVNVALVSYRTSGCIGVNMDPAAVDDSAAMTAALREGFDAVVDLDAPGTPDDPERA